MMRADLTIAQIAPSMLFLLSLCAIGIWERRARRRLRPHALIRIVVASAGLPTRPPFMDAESEAIASRIGDLLEGEGLGPLKVVFFQGIPTTDLLVETSETETVTSRVQTLLAGLPVTIANVGRPGDLRWHTKLWRHL